MARRNERVEELMEQLAFHVRSLHEAPENTKKYRRNDVHVTAYALSGLLSKEEFGRRVSPLLYGTGVRILFKVEPKEGGFLESLNKWWRRR